jgi:hypothetical protein
MKAAEQPRVGGDYETVEAGQHEEIKAILELAASGGVDAAWQRSYVLNQSLSPADRALLSEQIQLRGRL